MFNIAKFWNTIDTRILNSPRASPSTITIPRKNIDNNADGSLDHSFAKDRHYFSVMVNEMFLGRDREWFNQIEPMVYVVSEYTYKGKKQAVPFLVGPGLLKELRLPDKVANGVPLRNTLVAGPHSYRGGGLTLSVVLCKSPAGNVLKPLLQVIEGTAGALGLAPAVGPYLKLADVIMEGFQTLVSAEAAVPLVGLRDSYGPAFGTAFQPAYFALIDAPGVDPRTLWVKDNQLCRGASLESAKPYREADFVLYSIVSPAENKRDDLDELPFNDLWLKVQEEAASPVKDPNFKNAVQLMVTLYQTIVLSPDLTRDQADTLAADYDARMRKIHENAIRVGHYAAQEAEEGQERVDRARAAALALLRS